MKKLLFLITIGIALLYISPAPLLATVEGEDPRDGTLVYMEKRGDLDETTISRNGVPTELEIGVFTGYILPIWSEPVNQDEELYLSVCVPDRYDNEHDIVIEVLVALSDANELGHAYQLDLAWEKVTPGEEAVPATSNSDTIQRYVLSNTQYYLYRDYFVIDYDIEPTDTIASEDELDFRIRRSAIGGQYTDLDGDLIILHVGVLFPRGDLLGSPDEILTEADMEEIGIQFGVFNGIMLDWSTYISLGLSLAALVILSWLAYWRWSAVIFMLTAGVSITIGFQWYDTFTSWTGISISLMFIVYAILCVAFAFRCIFWRNKELNE